LQFTITQFMQITLKDESKSAQSCCNLDVQNG